MGYNQDQFPLSSIKSVGHGFFYTVYSAVHFFSDAGSWSIFPICFSHRVFKNVLIKVLKAMNQTTSYEDHNITDFDLKQAKIQDWELQSHEALQMTNLKNDGEYKTIHLKMLLLYRNYICKLFFFFKYAYVHKHFIIFILYIYNECLFICLFLFWFICSFLSFSLSFMLFNFLLNQKKNHSIRRRLMLTSFMVLHGSGQS